MKKLLSKILLPTLFALTLAGCGPQSSVSSHSGPDMTRDDSKVSSDSLYVKKVENLKSDFIMGMDASSVISEEQSGVKYYDYDGQEADVFKVLSESGVNYIRVRIWNNPYDGEGRGYGGGNSDLAKAIAIGKRATQYKMRLLVDFHYSDFWADPSKQMCPKAWKSLEINEKGDALYAFTKDCLQQLVDNDVVVGMVQLGNETTGGKMAGETRFSYFASLVNRGATAVREICPNALVAVHFTNPEKSSTMIEAASYLNRFNVDYDVFGSSYYSYWHGTLQNLSETLSTIATTYNKKVMVMETSYAFTTEDTDFYSNTIGEGSGYDSKPYPFTVAGQANQIRDIVDTIANDTTNGIGVCYWEGTWISVGSESREANSVKWQQYGSGWATSYASDYDPTDAGKWYGGDAVDNQAFFDATGHPLESLKIFNLARYGNDAPVYVDGIEDAEVSHYTYETFTLPETVNVIYNSNEKAAVPVVWEAFDIEEAKAKGNAKYDIIGTAAGTTVHCFLTILERNFLTNFGFEDGALAPWTFTNNGTVALGDTYQAAVSKSGNPQTGSYSFHFWAQDTDVANFNVEQTLSLTTAGTYKFQISTMGGTGTAGADAAKQNIYAYVKINGTVTKTVAAPITSYSDGYHSYLISDIAYASGDTLVVGFHVESSEAGVWGDIDDCMLNFVN